MAKEHQRRLLTIVATVGVACAVMAGIGAAWVVFGSEGGTPSCSWPLRIGGTATAVQKGLVRCYLRALAQRDFSALEAMAVANSPAVRITGSDMAYSRDARAGLATALFTPTNDEGYILLTIRFADGAVERAGMESVQNMQAWRMDIGTVINHGGPRPAKTG